MPNGFQLRDIFLSAVFDNFPILRIIEAESKIRETEAKLHELQEIMAEQRAQFDIILKGICHNLIIDIYENTNILT